MKKIYLGLVILIFVCVVGIATWFQFFSEPSDDSSFKSEVSDIQLLVEQVPVGTLELFSSSSLAISWGEISAAMDHYLLVLTDESGLETLEYSIEPGTTAYRAQNLKAGTSYQVVLKLCEDAACNNFSETNAVTGQTSEEYWQLQGTGHSFKTATLVEEDSTALAYVVNYEESSVEYPSALKFYGHTGFMSAMGTGISSGYQVEDDDVSQFKFSSHPLQSCSAAEKNCAEGSMSILAFQILPLTEEEKSLLCFEGYFLDPAILTQKDAQFQIYCLDSQDGWTADDFDKSSDTVCGNEDNEYKEGGNCELTKLIGFEDGLEQARQFKVGYPKLDSWKWNQSEESFIVITGKDECGYTKDGLFYGNWVNGEWSLHRDEKSCPEPIIQNAHGPVIVHLGGTRYKLYYEDYAYNDTDNSLSGLYVGKPFREIYIDLSRSEQIWEPESMAREVHFLWPDGSLLSAPEEAGLGDHVITVLNKDLEKQVMYTNLNGFDNVGDKGPSVGVGLAVLLN